MVFRDPITKLSLTAFVFAFGLTLAALLRIDDSVPLVTFYVASYACVASLAAFLFLIDHIGKASARAARRGPSPASVDG